jgi:tRNA-specific 2-thiouridylase
MILDETEQVRALVLLSGGLDSLLAVCLLKEQGINVHAVVFDSPFFEIKHARQGAERLDVELNVVNFSADIISILNNPKHGFGSCMNPCLDCHARMLRRAGELMEEKGCSFLATGEVLDERPMSQTRRGLELVAKESGYADRLVRPLSARLLEETEPERMGWVDRSRLLDIRGRGRRRQFELAKHYSLKDVPGPAGGCRLTEPNFCRRLKELKEHEGLDGTRSVDLLRFGRHFRLADNIKMVVGRNEGDNVFLEGTAELYDLILKVEHVPGPTGLLPLTAREEHVKLGAAICARYSDCLPGNTVSIRIRSSRGVKRMDVVPAEREEIERLRI